MALASDRFTIPGGPSETAGRPESGQPDRFPAPLFRGDKMSHTLPRPSRLILPRPWMLVLACLTWVAAAPVPAAGAPAVTPPTMQTFVANGGWCWFQDPRAIIAQGKLVVGAISIRPKASVKAAVFDLAAGKSLGTVVLNEDFQPDDHDAPVFHLRPDGTLLAMYAKHGTEDKHYYRISEPGDFLHWRPEEAFAHPGARVTYMNLYRMPGEQRLYCFYRRTERERQLYNPYFMTSDDEGDTWREGELLLQDGVEGVQRPYVRYTADEKAIHLLFTEAHPRDYNNSVYYAAFHDGSFYRADGTRIKDLARDGALAPREADQIYAGGEGRVAWSSSIVIDDAGFPHVAFSVRHSYTDHRFHHAYWDGAAWHEAEVAYAGVGLYEREMDYTGLITLDPVNPWHVYCSSDVDPTTGAATASGKHEIFEATLKPGDTREAILWRALTQHSPERNIRPVCVAGEGHKVLLWLRGPWHTYTDFDCDVVGMVLE